MRLKCVIICLFVVLGLNAQERAAEQYIHYVPADKNLSEEWMEKLHSKGERKVYRGEELFTIGMPCGGIGAGQLYVRGDGTFGRWWIFSDFYETTFYKKIPNTSYKTYKPEADVDQGFMLWAKESGKDAVSVSLSEEGFSDIGFIGEYPIATINYEGANEDLNLNVEAEVFSPFIPLDTKNSALPATIIQYHITNTSDKQTEVKIGGWLQNSAIPKADSSVYALRENVIRKGANYVSTFNKLVHPEGRQIDSSSFKMLEDFEGIISRADGTSKERGDLSKWKIEGDAFGNKAASIFDIQALGSRDFMYHFKGVKGEHCLFSQLNGRDKVGKVSREFNVQDKYLSFLIAGGNRPHDHKGGATCVNLRLNGQIVRTATGPNNWIAKNIVWDISEFMGKTVSLEIVDSNKSAAIAVDNFSLSNELIEEGKLFPLNHVSYGNMALSILDENGRATASKEGFNSFLSGSVSEVELARASMTDVLSGAVAGEVALKPGETKTLTFVLSWYFPNYQNNAAGAAGDVGRMYANWFANAEEVVAYIADNFEYLDKNTHAYRDAMYLNTSLPYWFTQRIAASSANMASAALEWWRNGRMYSWEGAGFCFGTCGHVWNYTQTPSRLFPELERSVRLMQDFNPNVSLNKTGRINFRGYNDPDDERFSNWGYIPDAQAGYVLKAYREHLMSADCTFLDTIYPGVKMAVQYLMERDARYGELNGVLEGIQHLTDNITFGANTFTGALYLSALRSAEEMAKLKNDHDFAAECRRLYEIGSKWNVEHLWNGEYFAHAFRNPGKDIMEKETGKSYEPVSMRDGCLADQVFGQNWAHQLGLGYVLPKDKVDTALESVYKYNWTTDMATVYKVMKKRFIFLAEEGEAGMVGLTYPKGIPEGRKLSQNDDPWTGYEYQVASHMMYEGMVDEGLSIAYGVHGRYDGVRHNPWNEIEGGDHYTRSMSAWGMLLGISGFSYDGPAGKIAFDPKMDEGNFKSLFTAAEGWGSYSQSIRGRKFEASLELDYGKLELSEIKLGIPEGQKIRSVKVKLGDQKIRSEIRKEGNTVLIHFQEEITIESGEKLDVLIH